ncbi:alpha/beta fold hydrolase [uncultured Leifsonia sp.]|uniref:alpha/beta fold hydrolase n=1 Tax=uncultured Leifsonia sp. TaxID=340359 RepID=UPI0025DD283F|nr:hypothetical protein [uncultured Leifsonia sp.]
MTTVQEALPAYDHRSGTGPTLVLLHSCGGSAQTWRPVVDRLPDSDVLSIDFRGWSRSNDLPGRYTMQRLATDTSTVLADATAGFTERPLNDAPLVR